MSSNASQINEQYKQGLQYHKTMQFTDNWPEYERFKASDQWPAATEATRNLPRPVFNIIDYIENHKVASVMNENIKMNFTAQELPQQPGENGIDPNDPLQKAVEGAEKFSKNADVTWEDLKQDEINEEVLESASNLGTGIAHYYMDNDVVTGIQTKAIGAMRGEALDPMNVFFGNPQNKDVQKQPYIIISSREMVQTVKEEAKKNHVPKEQIELIAGDKETKDEGYDAAQHELKEGDKCTILIRYTKKDGYIYLEKCTITGVTYAPEVNTRRKLYPVAVMRWKNRKKCIYGIGDTEGLIPNQKGINMLLAMMLLSAQNTAFPKIIAKFGALKQTITNQIGEILTDMIPNNTDNIKFMQPGNFSGETFGLVDKFIDLTKQMSAAQDAATGDIDTSNNTAAGIAMLQKAAGVPLESIKKRFYRFCEDVGLIWEEFYKVNYDLPRPVRFKDENGKEYPDVFQGSEYSDIGMSLKIDVGPSTQYSEALVMESLNMFYEKQEMTTEEYLELAPKNVVPFKDRFLKMRQARMQEQQPVNGENQMEQFMSQRTPEEIELIQNDPELQEQIINTFGGVQNEVSNMR